MAFLKIHQDARTLTESKAIADYLANYGIEYKKWILNDPITEDARAEKILSAYSREIEEMNKRGGYITADVIDIRPATPGLEAMLAKFNREHWHDEDEVRFVISGHGLFHIRHEADLVIAIEVEAGDLIRIPRGTYHWFDLCADRRIRAIRLFQDMAGWKPFYTNSGADKDSVPLCFGAAYIPLESRR